MQRVVFDSSFLMAVAATPTEWSTDIEKLFGGYEPVILECVKSELLTIASSGSKRSRAARLSLEIASRFKLVASGGASVDSEIVSSALTMPAAVATNDRELAKTLEAAHARVITLRSGRVFSRQA